MIAVLWRSRHSVDRVERFSQYPQLHWDRGDVTNRAHAGQYTRCQCHRAARNKARKARVNWRSGEMGVKVSLTRVNELTLVSKVQPLVNHGTSSPWGFCSGQIVRPPPRALALSVTSGKIRMPHVNAYDPLRPPSASSSSPSLLSERRFVYFFLAFSKSRLPKTRMNRSMIMIRTIAITGFRSRKGVRSAR